MKGLDQLAAEALSRYPNRSAIEFNGRWYDWDSLRHIAQSCIDALSHAGRENNVTVGLVARNRPASIAALLGLLSKGLSVRMIYPFMSPDAMAAELARERVDALLAEQHDFTDVLLTQLEMDNSAGIAFDEQGASLCSPAPRPTAPSTATPPRVSILTSGTTGKPKLFSLDYDSLAKHFTGSDRPPTRDEENGIPALLYFPVGNISGLYSSLPVLLSGRPAILLNKFSLDEWHRYIIRYRPEIGGLPPAAFSAVLERDIPVDDLRSLKIIGAGAAPLAPEVQQAFESRYGVSILLSYGATEFAGPVTRMTMQDRRQFSGGKLGSVGKPMPGVSLRIVDPDSDKECDANCPGILEVKVARVNDEWMRTADIGAIDNDGFLYIHGRADGAIIRGGFKILPETVETELRKHPAIADAAVIGIADARLGQLPAAVLTLKKHATTPTSEALSQFLRGSLPATHIPAAWRIVNALPRTALSYKVDRVAATALFEEPTQHNPASTASLLARTAP